MPSVADKILVANVKRLQDDIANITGLTSSHGNNGCTRHSYSAEDAEARTYLSNMFKQLGLSVQVDAVGNIRARYSGQDDSLPPVLVGSHIDTVTRGGRFDGLLGVVCALESIRVFKENGVVPLRPVELIVFAEEEGSNFGVTLIGSKALVGRLAPSALHSIYNDKKQSAYDVIRAAGYDADSQGDYRIQSGDIRAMLELHIEQGGILDSMPCPIGIVEAIAGMRTYKVVFSGVSNHAGSTPMRFRKDPMLGAAETILKVNEYAAGHEGGTVVATVGKIFSQPNSTNAIAGSVEFYVDIRDVSKKGIRDVSACLIRAAEEAAEKYKLSSSVEMIGESDIVRLDPEIIELLRTSAEALQLPYHRMNSGAVHDAVMMTDVAKVGMIFVPSIDGLSHCPQEDTKFEDIEKGCNLLIRAIYELAGR